MAGVRGHRLGGLKFRRQHPVGGYIVDFACVAARLVVEVDGPNHSHPEQATFDRLRTEELAQEGWTVLRFTNEQVLGDLPCVLAAVERAA